MTTSDGLTLFTLVVATISMMLSCVALWPQSRKALSFARDVVLWLLVIVAFVGVSTLGWRHFRVNYQRRPPPSVLEAAPGQPALIETSYVRRMPPAASPFRAHDLLRHRRPQSSADRNIGKGR